MIPVALDDCMAWLHPAAADTACGRAFVLVPALGFEELCTRRSLRILADRLALAGLATLRFDFHGTADSLGDEAAPDRIVRWRADTHRAVERLRELTGAAEIGLLGLRFGALIAADAAAGRDDIAMLGLLAPPASGRLHARETAALSRIIAPQPEDGQGGVAVAGFRLAARTVEALKRLDWPVAAPCPRLLVAAQGPGANSLADRWAAPDTSLQRLGFAGYERMICDPTASEVPFAAIDEIVAWARVQAPAAPATLPSPSGPAVLVGDGFTEEGVTFGPGGRLAGILCRPAAATGQVVIFTNSGGVPHIGWARMTVRFARALAARGIASLRMDFEGLGDSRTVVEPPTPFYYEAATRADISAAVDLVAAQGFGEIAVSGNCSGAHHAFHAALADTRIRALALSNLECFVWGPRYKLPLGAWMAALPVSVELKKRTADETLSEAARWQAWLKDRTVTLARRYAKPTVGALQRLAARFAPQARPADGGNAVAAGFAALSARGVRVRLVYSEGDAGLDELELYAGPEGSEATRLPGIDKQVIAGADHPMTSSAAQAAMLTMIVDMLVDEAAAKAA